MSAGKLKGYILVILSAVIFGCMPLMAKYVYNDGVTSLSLVFLRNLISLPMLAAVCFLKGDSLKIPSKDAAKIGLAGIMGCGITPLLLFSSYNYLASGTATVFHFVYPALVVIAEVVFLKKKMNPFNGLSVFLCIAGICLFYNPEEGINLFGSGIALLSGLAYAIYVVMLSVLNFRKMPGFVFSFYAASASTVFMFFVCILSGNLLFPHSLAGWAVTVLFAFSINVGAVVMFQLGTFIIGGQKSSVLSTFEPITGVIIGAAVFNEPVTAGTVMGTLLVIAAGIVIALSEKKVKDV